MTTDNNGHTDWDLCESFDANGEDRGVPVEFFDNVDFDSTWMGSYGLGDIQYHKSYLERVSLYWKVTPYTPYTPYTPEHTLTPLHPYTLTPYHPNTLIPLHPYTLTPYHTNTLTPS